MKKDRICEYCKKIFKNIEGRIFSNHVRWCNKNIDYDHTKCIKKISKLSIKSNEMIYGGKYKFFPVFCHKCGIKFKVKERERVFPKKENYFCTQRCANGRKHSKETKRKISHTIKCLIKNDSVYREKVFSNHLKTKIFSSKGERKLRKLIQNEYPQHEFTTGGNFLLKNGQRKSLDIYSKKIKLIIEYDGIYHFKDIHGNLKSVKRKDRLLETWCKKNKYKLIRISEDYYNKYKVQSILDLFQMIDHADCLEVVTKLYLKGGL